MRLLYMPCHRTLEYDQLVLFSALGFDVFSVGHYLNPKKPTGVPTRPHLNLKVNQELLDVFLYYHGESFPYESLQLNKDFVDRFDCVVVDHSPGNLTSNWDSFKNKDLVCWRSIGLSTPSLERMLKQFKEIGGLKLVRLSPMESYIPGYAGTDAVIRLYVNSEEFHSWEGSIDAVLTVKGSMKQSPDINNFDNYVKVVDGFTNSLFGPGNEGIETASGFLEYGNLKKAYRKYRVYFSSGHQPAPYTYSFIEAFMTGIPVVTFGPELGNLPGLSVYETSSLINNSVEGCWSDDINVIQEYLGEIMFNTGLAREISKNGRRKAKRLFDRHIAMSSWASFFNMNIDYEDADL